MIFRGMNISQDYQLINGNYQYVWTGEFDVESSNGSKLTLHVSPELCKKLLEICADAIVETATEAAECLRADVIEQLSPKVIEVQKPITPAAE